MQKRCTLILAAALVWLLPVAIHAQDMHKSPTDKPTGVPKIVFESLAHDFGTAQPNTPLTHNFVFTNQGTVPLLIEKVKAGWGCTAALASASEIPPGGEGKIKVTFKPGNRAGTQSKTVTVATNDPATQNLNLKVSATVEVVLAIKPGTIVFPAFTGKDGSREPLYARLTGSASASVNILSVKSANKLINVEFNKSGFNDDPSRQIRCSVQPGMPVGRFRERVILKTDNPSVTSLKMDIIGKVTGNIIVTPLHLPFGTITPGSTISKTISLKSAHDKYTFNILDVSSTVKEIATDLIAVTKGKEYRINVSLPDGIAYPIVRGEIVIKTDDKDQKSISIQVYGRTAPASRNNRPETKIEMPPM